MLFKLPEDLRKSLSGETETEKKAAPAKRKVNTLGKVDDLFPLELLSKDEQLKVVDEVATIKSNYRVNGSHVKGKFWSEGEYSFYLAYYSGLWVSFWSKKYTEGSNFIFGLSLAFNKNKNKENSTLSDMYNKFSDHIKNSFVDKKYVKSYFSYLTVEVTTDNLFEYVSVLGLSHFYRASDKIFCSFGCKERQRCCFSFIPGEIMLECSKRDPRYAIGSIYDFAKDIKWDSKSICKDFFKLPDYPFFRKKVFNYMRYVENAIQGCENYSEWFYSYRSKVQQLTRETIEKSNLIQSLQSLYGDVSLDLLQRVADSGDLVCQTYLTPISSDKNCNAGDWLRENVKPHTLVSLLCAEDSKLFHDTLAMLYSMNKSDLDKLGKPSRWRNRSFHDHVMVESFKNKGKDKPLPAELFPEPVKVGDWTYSQPRSTLELICWGKLAMNCVGSSDYYAGRVINRKSLIILASENGNPRLTIDLGLKENEILQIQDTVRGHSIPKAEMAKHAKRFLEAVEKVSASG